MKKEQIKKCPPERCYLIENKATQNAAFYFSTISLKLNKLFYLTTIL